MKAPSTKIRFSEAQKLLDYGFNTFSFKQFGKKGDVVKNISIDKGVPSNVDAILETDAGTLIEKGKDKNIEQTLTFEVTRAKVNTNPIYSEKLENNIGYLEITSFDEGVAEDFKSKYLALKEQGIKGLVIDLRDNGGGIVDEALKIVDYIVPKNQTT